MVTNNDLLTNAETKMVRAVEAFVKELSTIRTGRAAPALVDSIAVEHYGTVMLMLQLATITAPEARLLVIQPWDTTALPAIEKAILRSDLGLTPTNDGTQVRLTLPALTEERRRDLGRMVRRKVEESKITVRSVRRDTNDRIRTREKETQISQDESHRAQAGVQKLTDSFISQVEKIGQNKEAETLEG
jgi:ribosome recycling factor